MARGGRVQSNPRARSILCVRKWHQGRHLQASHCRCRRARLYKSAGRCIPPMYRLQLAAHRILPFSRHEHRWTKTWGTLTPSTEHSNNGLYTDAYCIWSHHLFKLGRQRQRQEGACIRRRSAETAPHNSNPGPGLNSSNTPGAGRGFGAVSQVDTQLGEQTSLSTSTPTKGPWHHN